MPVRLRFHDPARLLCLAKHLPAKDDKWGIEAVLCVSPKDAFEGAVVAGARSEYSEVSFRVINCPEGPRVQAGELRLL